MKMEESGYLQWLALGTGKSEWFCKHELRLNLKLRRPFKAGTLGSSQQS